MSGLKEEVRAESSVLQPRASPGDDKNPRA